MEVYFLKFWGHGVCDGIRDLPLLGEMITLRRVIAHTSGNFCRLPDKLESLIILGVSLFLD